jgi:hypothetical protein
LIRRRIEVVNAAIDSLTFPAFLPLKVLAPPDLQNPVPWL